MKASIFCCLGLSLFIFTTRSPAQDHPTGIDHYMKSGKTIFIAKCVNVGPVNILLRAVVDLEVIHVVKGASLPSKISVLSHVGMREGHTYLLRSEHAYSKKIQRLGVTTRDSVIRIIDYEDMATLLSLPPRIIILRTMNTRIHHLENKLRMVNYEMEALKAARKE